MGVGYKVTGLGGLVVLFVRFIYQQSVLNSIMMESVKLFQCYIVSRIYSVEELPMQSLKYLTISWVFVVCTYYKIHDNISSLGE